MNINNQLLIFKYKIIVSMFESYKSYLSKEQYAYFKKSINKIDFNKSIIEIEKDINRVNKDIFNSIVKII